MRGGAIRAMSRIAQRIRRKLVPIQSILTPLAQAAPHHAN